MNSKVFERAMFKTENKPTKANSGITQGFDEDYEDDEAENDEMVEEVSKRSPKSPEILMNNLRGDMRSVDARYQELAEMVGEDVAMETPPEVLAMLQPQLSAQAAPAGIGALPTQGVPPPPPPGGAPMPTPPAMPQMAQAPMPTDQGPAPQGFAYGGMVGSAPGYGPMSMMEPPMYQAAMAPQGYAAGGAVSNPAHGIQQFKNGGMVSQIMSRIKPQLAAQPAQAAQPISPEQLAAQKAEEDRRAAEALVQQRNAAFNTPTMENKDTKRMGVNPAFIEEFARRFDAGNVNRPFQPNQLIQAPRYTMQGNLPLYANGGVVDIPQAGANYNQGVSYSGRLEPGANYIRGAGRSGDTMLAHMKPEQHQVLTMMGGGSTTNPKTGLPEHFMGAGMATNLMQRIQPYAQAANQYIGSRMAPVLTPPSIQQSRTTLGTFGPKTVEGMELTYPSLTQRIGTVTEPVRNYVANMPATQKATAALATIPGGAAVMRAFGGGENVPNMPQTDVPAVIGTDAAGNRTYIQPPAPPVAEAKAPKEEPSIVEQAMEPPTEPKTEAQLIEQQGKKGKLENRLDAYMKENLPVFEKYMGGDKEASQIQALFLLADAGLEYATKPARTGMMALANAFKRVPAGLSQIAAQEEARKTQIRGAALTSGLQTISAEDKATSLLQREILKKAVSSGELVPTDRGAGLTSYTDKQGQDRGMKLDQTLVDNFLNSRTTPQPVKNKEGVVVGYNNPYVRVIPSSQIQNTDKTTREQLFRDLGNIDRAIATMDNTTKDIENAFGPGAFLSNLKNNVLVPVTPLSPNLMTADARTKVLSAVNVASKAIARAGDTGNIAVAEQANAVKTLGDAASPNSFFSNPETALQSWMTTRTNLLNQKFIIANQLGFVNQDVIFDTPNLGTKNDPIPTDKVSYVSDLARTNPKGTVYIRTPEGKVVQAPLSTITQ